jgi:hypothetical protein
LLWNISVNSLSEEEQKGAGPGQHGRFTFIGGSLNPPATLEEPLRPRRSSASWLLRNKN